MTVEMRLYARLAAVPAVAALLGDPPRVFPDIVPQDAILPHARYARIGTERPKAFVASPGISHASFQLDVWAGTSEDAKTIVDAIREGLDYWSDAVDGIGIQGILVEGENSDFEEDREEARRMLLFTVHSVGVE